MDMHVEKSDFDRCILGMQKIENFFYSVCLWFMVLVPKTENRIRNRKPNQEPKTEPKTESKTENRKPKNRMVLVLVFPKTEIFGLVAVSPQNRPKPNRAHPYL